MSIPGTRRIRRDGRVTYKTPKRMQIRGQFIPHRVDMIRSRAYRELGFASLRVLQRLEIEHADQGGKDNGSLICTFDDLVEFGVRRHAIAPAISELVAFGFLQVTQFGRQAVGDARLPAKYRLTYLPTFRGPLTPDSGPTDEWELISEEAHVHSARAAIAAEARARKSRARNRIRVTETSPRKSAKQGFPGDGNVTTRPVAKTSPPSIACHQPAADKPPLHWSTPTLTEVADRAEAAAIGRACWMSPPNADGRVRSGLSH
jgi:hypothetical protein